MDANNALQIKIEEVVNSKMPQRMVYLLAF
jgi:hypothetical protein